MITVFQSVAALKDHNAFSRMGGNAPAKSGLRQDAAKRKGVVLAGFPINHCLNLKT
jgi:hypothetical protein